MIWNDIFESKTTEPPVGKIEMNFFTQASLGPNSETVTNDEHAYHQFGINGGATGVTIKRRKMTAKIAKVKELLAESAARHEKPQQFRVLGAAATARTA